jgi:hypothetical protein
MSKSGLIAVIVALSGLLVGAVLVLAAVLGRTPSAVSDPIVSAAPPVAAAPTHEVTLAERLDGMAYPEAVATLKPMMSDTVDAESPVAALLGLWAADHMQWSDIAVTVDETSNALARKDPDAARGKRVCTSGTIHQIVVDRSALPRRLAVGQMDNGSMAFYHFIAVRSTGALVVDSWARFCGVVTGIYNFTNRMNGTTESVAIVGMFDLPENRGATAPSRPLPTRHVVVVPGTAPSLGLSPTRL